MNPSYETQFQPTERYAPSQAPGDPKDSYPALVTVSQLSAPKVNERGFWFWMCMVSIMLSSFVMAMDLTGITTALPVIVRELHGEQFEWVGSAYALSAAAFLPLSGGLAQVFGRRLSMLLQLFLFALGSALCGASTSMNFLIAGRTVQGIGAGGISSLSQIIISDLVPLHERGTYNALLALAYAMSSGIATIIAGALAQHGQWRWFFYMNLPFCAVSAIITAIFVSIEAPRGSFKDKLFSLDWIGNLIVVASTTAVVIALTWGGIKFPWNSAQVLVPLILGLFGLVAFVAYDAKFPDLPLVPFKIMSSTEAVSGYLQGFFTNFYMISLFYYLPVYFQACKDASPTRSGVLVLTTALTTMPFGIISGISVAKLGKYRPQLWLAWACLVVAAGLFSTLHADSVLSASVGFQVISSLGIGILLTCTFFPILAPISLSLNANALAFFMFTRFFAQSWGVSAGGTVLQNELKKRLPADFIAQFPRGTSVAFSIIPIIPQLDEPLKTAVQIAFAESLRVLWQVMTGVAALGLLSSLLMKGLKLEKSTGDVMEPKSSEDVELDITFPNHHFRHKQIRGDSGV
ncbi:iron permease [Phellopilus nigrolimitatus]|nr:iron permease [Phellopilus nigrolimitatus]